MEEKPTEKQEYWLTKLNKTIPETKTEATKILDEAWGKTKRKEHTTVEVKGASLPSISDLMKFKIELDVIVKRVL